MDNCAKCGKELSWSDNGFWNKQLESGYIEFNKWNWSIVKPTVRKEFPNYKSKKSCRSCMLELMNKDEAKNGRFCVNCTFYHRIYNKLESLMLGLSIDTFQPYYCKKLKMNLENPLGNEAENCTSYLTPKEYKEKALSGEMNKDKANVQIILDFSSLKDVMSKGGLVMSTYKCPNCNGMVNIPEEGKVLMCEYCGIPIKPVDIFEKIKTLVQ